ncbi:hypothetical protein CC80DRAFT_545688 [Byssothecium circinans]|uniref:C2H2-type domain-containing protein n=1 Tax=Byssothecium circinans TaxID=147558 RepID=A0A6A5UDY5_9PLEO|nr:hypothetical protein CC80DRAFT_545688 [Byssothecium circinans]
MTQPNNNNHFNPTFNFSIDGQPFFTPRSTHQVDPNTQYPQWQQQNHRTLGSISSPSPSPRTPIPGPFSNQGMGRPPAPQQRQENNMDPNSMLAVPPPGRPRSALDNVNTMDLSYKRVYSNMHDEPWSSVRMRNPTLPSNTGGHPSAYARTDVNYGSYREPGGGSTSDIDSGAPQSDSGYFTHQAHSVRSNEPERVNQELPASMTFGVHSLNVNTQIGSTMSTATSSEPTEVVYLQSDQASQYSGRSAGRSPSHGHASGQGRNSFKCPRCKEVSKCPSDFKKHMLKHDKPHICDVRNCRRAAVGKGFTTKNDLDRHKKSVHHVGVEKDSYQCASENCRNRSKIWPRLDNFKQHISRMHKGEDEQDLIRRSAYQEPYPPPPPASGESISVAPLDTTLAGIGTSGAGNELVDDPASGISLTPDQDPTDRFFGGGFHPTADGFALDVDRTNNDFNKGLDHNFGSSSTHRHGIGHGGRRRRRQDSLSVLADVAGSVGSRLSSAPQTKAEQQQRQALQKFSKAIRSEIQNAPSGDDVDLESVVLRVLYGATGNQPPRPSVTTNLDTSNSTTSPDIDIAMTKTEALKASQAISSLIKRSSLPHNSHSRSRRSSKATASSPPGGGIPCPRCTATLSRSCDLKKHMKRHTRPYGCTYPQCFKRFGAKSDWKRHENSQHFQLEAFLCHHTLPCLTPSTSSPIPCAKIFYRAELFRAHLVSEHRLVDSERIDRDVRERRIGKNGQGQFWCGFCRGIVKLKERRNEAWDERFNHIDRHFCAEGRGIDEWVCVEAGRCKGEILKGMDRGRFDDDGEGEGDADAEGEGRGDVEVEGSSEGDLSPPPVLVFEDADIVQERDVEVGVVDAGQGQGAAGGQVFFPEQVEDIGVGVGIGVMARKRGFGVDEGLSVVAAPPPHQLPKRRRREIDRIDRYCVSFP